MFKYIKWIVRKPTRMPNGTFLSKHQPLYLANFEIDAELLSVLMTLINMDNLNILFIGDTGCGKSSIIDAIIREYYAKHEEQNKNILKINNLKEHGINYFRVEFKIFCQTCSSILNKKKIVVLDDIDMIHSQNQQVLRNCIDKYNHKVHFIGSCTNSQNVIETLQSRFIIVKIHPTTRANLFKILDRITTVENICIDNDAKNHLLDICNSQAKILITYLEKFKLLNQQITLKLVKDICTNIPFEIMNNYIEYLKTSELNKGIALLYSIFDMGYSVMDIFDNLFIFVKITPSLTEQQKYILVPLLCKYITHFHIIHEDEIEMALFTNAAIKELEQKN